MRTHRLLLSLIFCCGLARAADKRELLVHLKEAGDVRRASLVERSMFSAGEAARQLLELQELANSTEEMQHESPAMIKDLGLLSLGSGVLAVVGAGMAARRDMPVVRFRIPNAIICGIGLYLMADIHESKKRHCSLMCTLKSHSNEIKSRMDKVIRQTFITTAPRSDRTWLEVVADVMEVYKPSAGIGEKVEVSYVRILEGLRGPVQVSF